MDLLLSVALLISGALALVALPWTDADILRVHRAALKLIQLPGR